MKFSKLSQLFLVSAIGLLVASLLTACQLVSVDYVFLAATAGVGTSTDGSIQTFAVDSQSGALRTGQPDVDSGGVAPIAMAVSAQYTDLYVAHQGDNSVVHFAVGSTGVLTKKDSVTLSAPPTALAVNAAGTYLYVVSGSNSATLSEFALSSGTIGAVTQQENLVVPGYTSDVIIPTGVTVIPNNNAVYVTAYDQSAYNPGGGSTTSTANPGWVFGYAVGSGGALAPSQGSPYLSGVKPSAVAAEPTNRFIYVTDFASNELIGYSITSGSSLNFLVNGPFKTGNQPSALAIDPRGIYIYVTNFLDETVSSYQITLSTGTPTATVSSSQTPGNTTGTEPVSVAVDPALGRFVYTANYLDNTVSGFQLTPTTGVLKLAQATPYPSAQKPTALVIVPHGNHAIQSITP
jgi:6-phosphogluconolactonase (cycloisomerase 2 family)